jgi:hypothetical protein
MGNLHLAGPSSRVIYGVYVLYGLNAGMVGSNPTGGIEVCQRFYVVLSCVGRGLMMG